MQRTTSTSLLISRIESIDIELTVKILRSLKSHDNSFHVPSPTKPQAVMDLDGASDKPRLSSAQKKANHIESEKKRREAIRKGFERLSKIVPDCDGQARSEAVVLQRTVQYLREQLEEKDKLKKQAMERGMSEGDFEQV